MQATFIGQQIATDAYLNLRGLSNPRIVSFPRTVGVLLQESGVSEQSLLLKGFMIGDPNTKRSRLEAIMHSFNELFGTYGTPITGPNGVDLGRGGTLVVNGNTFNNAYVKTGTFVPTTVNNRLEYTVEFILGDQNTNASIVQLPVNGLVGFNRGRVAKFTSQIEDGTYKTFTFWHNVDLTANFETYIVVKHSFSYGGHAKVVKTGGYEKVVLNCWLADDNAPRQAIEAYIYNILNGPLGRLGVLYVDNQLAYSNAILQEVTMEDTPRSSLKYQLTFLVSLQC